MALDGVPSTKSKSRALKSVGQDEMAYNYLQVDLSLHCAQSIHGYAGYRSTPVVPNKPRKRFHP